MLLRYRGERSGHDVLDSVVGPGNRDCPAFGRGIAALSSRGRRRRATLAARALIAMAGRMAPCL